MIDKDFHFPSWVAGYLSAGPSRPEHDLWSFLTSNVRKLHDAGRPGLEGLVFFALAVSTRAENAVPSPSQWTIYRDMLQDAFSLGSINEDEHRDTTPTLTGGPKTMEHAA
jgi:hypothetical protein